MFLLFFFGFDKLTFYAPEYADEKEVIRKAAKGLLRRSQCELIFAFLYESRQNAWAHLRFAYRSAIQHNTATEYSSKNDTFLSRVDITLIEPRKKAQTLKKGFLRSPV